MPRDWRGLFYCFLSSRPPSGRVCVLISRARPYFPFGFPQLVKCSVKNPWRLKRAMNDWKSALFFFLARLPAEKKSGEGRGGLSALAVSTSGNFKQQSHRVFVLYGFSMCGDESCSFSKSPSGKETLSEFLIRAEYQPLG